MYAADKWKPCLLGKDSAERANVNMAAFVIKDFKAAVSTPMYQVGDRKAIIEVIEQRLPPVAMFMNGNKFMVGDQVTWVDFQFWEFLQIMKFIHPEVLVNHKYMQKYDEEMPNLPGLKEYLEDPKCIDRNVPFNNKHAKLNN